MVRRTGDFLFVTLEKRADGRDCHGFEKRRFLSWLLLGFNVAFVCRRRHGIALRWIFLLAFFAVAEKILPLAVSEITGKIIGGILLSVGLWSVL